MDCKCQIEQARRNFSKLKLPFQNNQRIKKYDKKNKSLSNPISTKREKGAKELIKLIKYSLKQVYNLLNLYVEFLNIAKLMLFIKVVKCYESYYKTITHSSLISFFFYGHKLINNTPVYNTEIICSRQRYLVRVQQRRIREKDYFS